jgi:MFS family permease
MWFRVSAFGLVLFFVLLADAVLADWVPGYMQGVLGSPAKMGLMMAFSSLIGLAMDVIFPQMLRSSGVHKLAGGAIVGSLVFILSMLGSTWFSYGLILMVAMAAWGIYYELDSFMTKQFVAGVAPREFRSAVWGAVGVVRNLAYFFGPIIGGMMVGWGDRGVVFGAGGVLALAYILFLFIKLPHLGENEEPIHGLHPVEEIKHWFSLGRRIWTILVMSVMLGVIDATFWTTGTVLNDRLAEVSQVGGWFLPAYMVPSLFIGVVIAKWGVSTGKKKWAELFVLLGCALLGSLIWMKSVESVILVVVMASIFMAMAWPLLDAVYTDLVVRAKRGRKHMIGLSSSTLSMGYIIGPIIAGFLAGKFGELTTFAITGWGVAVITLILMMVTPKKLHLPQTEMETWDRDNPSHQV